MERKPYPGAPLARHLKVEPPNQPFPKGLGERQFVALTRRVEDLRPYGQYVIAGILLVGVTVLDIFVGPEITFSIFYLLPVSMLAWHRGWNAARPAVLVATLLWLLADLVARPEHTPTVVEYWNAMVSFGVFAIVGYTLSRLRTAVDQEQRLARTDILTGVANVRAFNECLAHELVRQQRYEHPLSLAFLDCDNFKQVNDHFGHARGDDLLRTVAAAIYGDLREVDVVARLGGDEFAILLPESDVFAAETVAHKLRALLQEVTSEYGVTFSIGLVTYLVPAENTDDILHTADLAMYEAKRSGKNTVRHRIIATSAAEGTNA